MITEVVVAGPGGFEPPTTGSEGRRSVLAELRALSGIGFVLVASFLAVVRNNVSCDD